MADVRALAIRFADLWAVDHHQMVDEIYAPAIHMEPMARPGAPIDGLTALHALEDDLALRIPAHRHELVRVLVDAPRAFLETTVVGPTTGEYAQAAVWWRLDGGDDGRVGRVVHEIGWFNWDLRTSDARRSRGSVPPDDGRPRGADWYERRAHLLAAAWNVDPVGAVTEHLRPGTSVTRVGFDERTGAATAAALAQHVTTALPAPSVEVTDVLGEGAVMAVLCTVTYDGRRTRGTIVVTFDPQDEIAGIRAYVDWARSVAIDETTAVRPDELEER